MRFNILCMFLTCFIQVFVTLEHWTLHIDEIRGFVTAAYDDQCWYLACVLQTDVITSQVTLSYLEPPGPAKSFKFPAKEDRLHVPSSDILTLVDPVTETGRTLQTKTRGNPESQWCTFKMVKAKSKWCCCLTCNFFN